jgi:hypothetical protein
MPGPLLHVGAFLTCPHGSGQFFITTTNIRVFVSGMPVVTANDIPAILGCPVNLKPCVTARMIPSARIKINGQHSPNPIGIPAITYLPGSVVCQSADQSPQGPAIAGMIQTRVQGI